MLDIGSRSEIGGMRTRRQGQFVVPEDLARPSRSPRLVGDAEGLAGAGLVETGAAGVGEPAAQARLIGAPGRGVGRGWRCVLGPGGGRVWNGTGRRLRETVLRDQRSCGGQGMAAREGHGAFISAIQARIKATPSSWASERPSSGIITPGSVDAIR